MLKPSRGLIAVLVFIACAAYAIPASAATTVGAPLGDETMPGDFTCPWGAPSEVEDGIVSFGEIVTVPETDTVLDSFSFYVTQLKENGEFVGEPQTITYKAYVGKWDGSDVTEPVWESDSLTVTTSPDRAQWETTVPTGGVELEAGQQYALYFSTLETNGSNTPEDRACFIHTNANEYAGGASLVRTYSDTAWRVGIFGADNAFSASFSEPVGGGEEAPAIIVDQACIDPGSPETGGGLVSGRYTNAPTGAQYSTQFFVSADQNSGDDWTHYGGDYGDNTDAEGNGTFSFNLASYYGPALPDTLWVKGRVYYRVTPDDPGMWIPFAETEVPVCGRNPDPDPDPDTDGDGVVDSVDNCDNAVNPGQENNDVDAEGDACDADDDNDGVNDGGDNCQFTANPLQRDDDQDGVGDACDGTFDSSDGKSSGGGWVATPDGKINFSASAKSVDGVMAGNCVVTLGAAKIKCLTVDGYYQSPSSDRAVFVGSATQDGVATRYRIELTDNGEPGTSDRIEITTDLGFAAAGELGSGNLQVHFGV